MKVIKIYNILFILIIINILKVNSNFIDSLKPKNKIVQNENKKLKYKRSIDGTENCRPLPFNKDKALSLLYNSISIIFPKARTTFTSCYLEIEKGLIVCNELTARRVFLFYLPSDVIRDDYGYYRNKTSISCNLENSKILEWKLWHQENGSNQDVTDFKLTNKPEEDAKYHFTLDFDNECTYNVQIKKVQSVRVTSFSYCNSKYKN